MFGRAPVQVLSDRDPAAFGAGGATALSCCALPITFVRTQSRSGLDDRVAETIPFSRDPRRPFSAQPPEVISPDTGAGHGVRLSSPGGSVLHSVDPPKLPGEPILQGTAESRKISDYLTTQDLRFGSSEFGTCRLQAWLSELSFATKEVLRDGP